MDDYNLFPDECHLNFLNVDDEEFLSHDIASALQGQTLQQSLSSECTSKTLSNSFTDETSFDFERPAKLLKTISTTSGSNSSSITENISPKLSPSSSISSFQSQILSFDNPTNSSPANTTQFYGFECAFNPKQNEMVSLSLPQLGNPHLSTQTPKGSSKNQNFETKTSHSKRSPAHAQDHIMAERKRREKLSQSFIALAALVPGLKKMDKASVLADAIKYVKELKERLAVLEEQSKKTKGAESVVVLNKSEVCGDDDSSSCDESIEGNGATKSMFQVEARVSGQEMLIRIYCHKHKGIVAKILTEIQSFSPICHQ
ncbi:Myc-type, basic helix-loop-helix [Sesbania bispinosa]|nr:Myc-type, basic helix-loop-helix [Sesbania bispinosa]